MRPPFTSKIRRALPKKGIATTAPCKATASHGRLIVHCRDCHGNQDLADHDCLKGIVLTISTEPITVGEIVLSRHWEVRYDHRCTQALSGLAEVVRFLRGINFEPIFDDCETCRRNPHVVADRAISLLPNIGTELEEACMLASGPHGQACEKCIRSLGNNLEHARTLLMSTNATINRAAYRVVSSHAT